MLLTFSKMPCPSWNAYQPDRFLTQQYIMVSSANLPQESLTSIQTDRLILRPINMDHVDALHRIIYADPDVALFYAGEVQNLEETHDIVLQQYMVEPALRRSGMGILGDYPQGGHQVDWPHQPGQA